MGEVSRRGFLFGTVASAAAGTALVLSAKRDALKLFQPTVDEIVAINRLPTHRPYRLTPIDIGETLYNAEGEPICMVTRINVEATADLDVTFHMETKYIAGPLVRVDLDVEPLNPYALPDRRRRRA